MAAKKRQRVIKGRHQDDGKKPEIYEQRNTRTKIEDAVVDPPSERKPDKREREDDEKPGSNKHVKFMCLLCKDNDRRFNHPPDKCNYAKGGIWHGLKGAELKDAKRAFFE